MKYIIYIIIIFRRKISLPQHPHYTPKFADEKKNRIGETMSPLTGKETRTTFREKKKYRKEKIKSSRKKG